MSSAEEKGEATSKPVKRRWESFAAYWALAALIAGLLAGIWSDNVQGSVHDGALAAAGLVGNLWLNALKMTVVPLVVALLVVGVAQSAEAAGAGRIAGRTMVWVVALCTASAIVGVAALLLLTHLAPLPVETAAALRSALSAADQKAASAPLPGIIDFFRDIVPSNVVSAAANGDILPLVIFSLLFALALTRIPPARRDTLLRVFEAIADALLILIGWVLVVAPLGVFALAFGVGAAAGGAAFAGLGHYVLMISAVGILITLAAYPIGIVAGGIRPLTFARGLVGPQAVAISTRSSLASLPAMLASARAMGIRENVADVTLPISVALFRATGPAMNAAVAFYVAHWLGYQPSVGQIIAATAVAAVMSYGAVSLPGEISFISSIAPIAMALGVPIAPLALLVAVEMVPDIFRTVGNVSADVAVTAAVDRSTREPAARG